MNFGTHTNWLMKFGQILITGKIEVCVLFWFFLLFSFTFEEHETVHLINLSLRLNKNRVVKTLFKLRNWIGGALRCKQILMCVCRTTLCTQVPTQVCVYTFFYCSLNSSNSNTHNAVSTKLAYSMQPCYLYDLKKEAVFRTIGTPNKGTVEKMKVIK